MFSEKLPLSGERPPHLWSVFFTFSVFLHEKSSLAHRDGERRINLSCNAATAKDLHWSLHCFHPKQALLL